MSGATAPPSLCQTDRSAARRTQSAGTEEQHTQEGNEERNEEGNEGLIYANDKEGSFAESGAGEYNSSWQGDKRASQYNGTLRRWGGNRQEIK